MCITAETITPESSLEKAITPAAKAPRFFTIDSEHTRDIDDAIAIEAVPGGVRIRVAIANAAAQVQIGSTEDIAAANLAATAYSGEHVLCRMLPRRISEQAGSLLEGRRRQAVVYDIVLDEHMQVTSFVPSVQFIKVAQRLSYEKIPAILESSDDPLKQDLTLAANVARSLLASRRNRGALALYDLTMLLVTDEDGNVKHLRSKAETIGYIIVQEMMILVNATAAPYLAINNIPCVYRNHMARVAAPSAADMVGTIEQWLISGSADSSAVKQRLAMFAEKARYEATCRGHYALNLPAYGHFTSPLRRYADLVNQRQLIAHLAGQPLPYSQEDLGAITARLNEAIEHRNDERREGFKQSVQRRATRALDRGDLERMADHELCAAVKIGCSEDVFPEGLQQELVRRMSALELTDKVAVCMLFDVPREKLPLEVRQGLGKWLSEMPPAGKAVSMCNVGNAINRFSLIKYDVSGGEADFSCVASLTADGEEFVGVARGAKKKEAMNQAVHHLMLRYIGIEVPEAPSASSANADALPQTPKGNSKGKLLELCVARRLPMPAFTSSGAGPSHAMKFTCTATLEVAGVLHEVRADGCQTKKDAEQHAASKLLERLGSGKEPGKQVQVHAANDVAELLGKAAGSANPIGALLEIAQKLAIKAPSYDVTVDKADSGLFCCEVTTYHSGEQKFVGRAQSKQAAKTAAAQAAIKG